MRAEPSDDFRSHHDVTIWVLGNETNSNDNKTGLVCENRGLQSCNFYYVVYINFLSDIERGQSVIRYRVAVEITLVVTFVYILC